MKTFLLSVLLALGILPGAAWADSVWIVVTVAGSWADGMTEDVGEVELVVKETPEKYFIWHPNGKEYGLPKSNATVLTADEAARRLIAKRQALYDEVQAARDAADLAEAKSAGQGVPARPTQYNGRPLPRNWIDPKQADANFAAQQSIQAQRDAARAAEAQAAALEDIQRRLRQR